ncbi:MAG: hypothetical protein MUF49_01160 [Oculatellaceae cyanobacterium Prado106]|jgi:hypothetical protein|nr:hypothetical protein [Oculatellaceae cyanobacterium Prado106]
MELEQEFTQRIAELNAMHKLHQEQLQQSDRPSSLSLSKPQPNWRVRLTQQIQAWVEKLSRGSEPRIEHGRDRQGHSYLKVYDPLTGKTAYFQSSQEVRIWLEQRYYQ